MSRKNFTISRMVCTNCNREGIPIPRKVSQARAQGHLKELYCLTCRGFHNHIEFRSEWDELRYNEVLERVE